MNDRIIVHKLNAQHQEIWSYPGRELQRSRYGILIEASFNRDDMPFHEINLKRGDRFVEAYFFDRWYNIDEIYDRDDGRLKAWYCNVTTPAVLAGVDIRYSDLALDLLVYPDGRQQVLDEDEFEAERLDEDIRRRAREALRALEDLVKPRQGFRLADYFSRLEGA